MKINFSFCDEFQKEFKQFCKAYQSLVDDFEDVKKALEINPILPQTERINNLSEDIFLPIFKMRKIFCRSLQSNSKLRIIYIYDDTKQEIKFIQFLEIYTKSDKDNEDRKRIEKYAKGKKSLSD
ncbi:MAG: hypothetical protein WC872_02815 [Candidatus Absconditabacterales bacterium]